MKLYEIDNQILEAVASADIMNEDGEFKIDLDGIMLERESKLENIGLYIKNLSALADGIKAEEKALYDRRKSIERKIEYLKEYVENSVITLGGIETARIRLSLRKSESVDILNPDLIPAELTTVKTTVTPDKTKIKELLKQGKIVDGAELVVKHNLQIK